MIFTGNQTPYQQRQNKTSDMSAATLLTSDAVLNTSIADYITVATRAQTINEIIKNIVLSDMVDETAAVATISAILGVK